ncbi:MAG: COX15/CtaA family protein [Candidatus Cyclobacteriaceae bacterium M3_2C_046]
MKKHRVNFPLVTWLLYGCILIFVMVIIGGITRLTHSGLSMVEWDLIMGAIPPLNELEWQTAFDQYKQFPEYQKLHYHFNLADFKSIFWWEYIHRLIGRFIGIVFIIPFLYFWLTGKISKRLMPKLLLIFALGAFQGFLGWYMVKSGLVDRPYVSHYRLAIHLMAAFITFGFTFWVALDEIYKFRPVTNLVRVQPLKKLSLWFLVVLAIQIIYGAFVAGLKAGFVYNTFPKMGDRWIAEGVTAMQPFYLNFLEGLAGVQFVHRYLAYILVILAAVIWYKARQVKLSSGQSSGVTMMMVMVALQVLMGIYTLVWAVPVWLGVLHQAGAFILLGMNIYLLHRLSTPEVQVPAQPKARVLEVSG